MNWGSDKRVQLFLEDFEDWLFNQVEKDELFLENKNFVLLLIDDYLEEVRLSTLHKRKIKKLFNGD